MQQKIFTAAMFGVLALLLGAVKGLATYRRPEWDADFDMARLTHWTLDDGSHYYHPLEWAQMKAARKQHLKDAGARAFGKE